VSMLHVRFVQMVESDHNIMAAVLHQQLPCSLESDSSRGHSTGNWREQIWLQQNHLTFQKQEFVFLPQYLICKPSNTTKVKLTLEQAMKAQRGSRGIALLFL
jgi:hypothetical protein